LCLGSKTGSLLVPSLDLCHMLFQKVQEEADNITAK
jgi:hypothetical protein